MSSPPTTTTIPSLQPSDSPAQAHDSEKVITSLQMTIAGSQASSDDSNASAPSVQTPNTSQQESPMIPLQPQTSPDQKADRPHWSFGPSLYSDTAKCPSPTNSEEANQQERLGQGPLDDAGYLPITGQWSPLQSRLGGFQQQQHQQQQQREPVGGSRYGGATKTQYSTDGDAGPASRDYQHHQ